MPGAGRGLGLVASGIPGLPRMDVKIGAEDGTATVKVRLGQDASDTLATSAREVGIAAAVRGCDEPTLDRPQSCHPDSR